MKKEIYLFKRNELSRLSFHALLDFKVIYFQLLSDNPFPKPPESGHFYDMIQYLKRKDESLPLKIGAYEHLTLFEAANRIASDLVIINGLIQLVQKNKEFKQATFTLRLGTTHTKDKGDFTIHTTAADLEGEAFNVAPSFLQQKMRLTRDKWKDKPELKYILVNDEAFNLIGKAKIDERVFRVKNWEI